MDLPPRNPRRDAASVSLRLRQGGGRGCARAERALRGLSRADLRHDARRRRRGQIRGRRRAEPRRARAGLRGQGRAARRTRPRRRPPRRRAQRTRSTRGSLPSLISTAPAWQFRAAAVVRSPFQRPDEETAGHTAAPNPRFSSRKARRASRGASSAHDQQNRLARRPSRLPTFMSDILSDEDVRQGLKAYSEWPTYPQFYVHGSLIGGAETSSPR